MGGNVPLGYNVKESRWSVRSMAHHAGVSPSTVQRIWANNNLKPHITKTFKLSNDPKFEEKRPNSRYRCAE